MKLRMLLSLLLMSGVLFMYSCGGKEEKQPALEQVGSVDDIILDTNTNTQSKDIIVHDTVVKVIKQKDGKAQAGGDVIIEEPVSYVQGGDYSKKALQGAIVSLNSIASGGNGIISKAQAQEMATKGNLVVFKALDGIIYFVYNEDGSFAGKRIAGFANNQKVGMLGKAKIVDGINVFIMTMIEAM